MKGEHQEVFQYLMLGWEGRQSALALKLEVSLAKLWGLKQDVLNTLSEQGDKERAQHEKQTWQDINAYYAKREMTGLPKPAPRIIDRTF